MIFVTAHDDEAAETLGLEVGAVDFISKPINPKIVRARVRTHLTLKAQSDLLRQWVYLDGLTGVHNRRHFDERLAVEWARALRHGTDLSVLLLDVDFFKAYNDRYGHQAGDDCLRLIAACLGRGIRRPGTCWPATAARNSPACCPTRPCKARWPSAGSWWPTWRHWACAHAGSAVAEVVTVSVGACTKPFDGAGTAAALLREADTQLYLAKSRGRNQVCGAELPGG